MRESINRELKKDIPNTFLKTVSAYANYIDGEIIFGIADDGEIVGIENPREATLSIENKINDSIDPIPSYSLEIDKETNTIILRVKEGMNKPYFYRSKAYQRSDTSSVEVDRLELNRLILLGENKNFDELNSKNQNLNFDYLEEKLQDKLGIDKLTEDILITLELLNKTGKYTNAGELFSDDNSFKGVDIVKFGENIDIILHRYTLNSISILEQYDRAVEIYRENYEYEVIDGAYRKTVQEIPENAFREAVANALVHRRWDINASIQISMFKDHIVVTSPGNLPEGLSEDEYLHGQISILRNPIIANIFHSLDIIESFGTCIRRIYNSYSDSNIKPSFSIFDNSIQIKLPLISQLDNLTEDEILIYDSLAIKNLPALT